MKAVVNVEFFVSAIVFAGTIFFLIISIMNSIPQFHEGSLLISLRSRSYEISELLLLDEGAPRSWTTSDVQRIGLSTNEKYILSLRKINDFSSMCAGDYNRVRDIITGDPKLSITVKITNADTGQEIAKCEPPAVSAVLPQSIIRRYAAIDNGNKAILEVGVA